jgi:hypothetical protein
MNCTRIVKLPIFRIIRLQAFETEARSKQYLRILSVPQRQHNTSPLERADS